MDLVFQAFATAQPEDAPYRPTVSDYFDNVGTAEIAEMVALPHYYNKVVQITVNFGPEDGDALARAEAAAKGYPEPDVISIVRFGNGNAMLTITDMATDGAMAILRYLFV